MIISILYVILAILGLSFLIFIHELGHYYMARRLGMRVETFSIGFGKPIYSWERKGVRWQIGWLLFGGYVKIAGMDGSDQNIYDIKDGFFGKRPWDRIKVAAAGPIVNIIFSFLVFILLWFIGGREKNFSEFTSKIGWVDPQSELYANGIRPGDEVVSYDDHLFQGAKDHIYAPMTGSGDVEITGSRVNFFTKQKNPFHYLLKTYPHPASKDKDFVTAGILQPASYLIYDYFPNGQENPLPTGSPMESSGIQYGDRIVWVDGELVYSVVQLQHILNDSKALVTVQRGQDILLRRVPRVHVEELKLDPEIKEELIDWQFEAHLNQIKIPKLYSLPYNMNNEGTIEGRVKFIDKDNETEAFPSHLFSGVDAPLEEGDKILAIDGFPVQYSYEILSHLQTRHVNVIVQRDQAVHKKYNWKEADDQFDHQIQGKDLQRIISQIGLSNDISSSGNLVLLNPIVPKQRSEFTNIEEGQFASVQQNQKKEIEKIEDPEKRAQALTQLENRDKQLFLGIPLQDKRVKYNPYPGTLFGKVFEDIWRTLTALFTGSLSPKMLSGPVGIVQVTYDYSLVSLKEAFFLLGAISLNLGVLNLLPLPILDGGTILLSFYEMITGQKLKAKTMEKLIIPFAVLLIAFFIYLTYHDLTRLFKDFL